MLSNGHDVLESVYVVRVSHILGKLPFADDTILVWSWRVFFSIHAWFLFCVVRKPNKSNQVFLCPDRTQKWWRLARSVDFSGDLRFSTTPETLQICEVPRLRGLVFEKPIRNDALVKGLRDLEWFAAFGTGVDDELVDEVANCTRIQKLTLAYHDASRESMFKIGRLQELNLLIAPGAKIDDEVTSNWNGVTRLLEANFDDNSIGGETLAWLSRNKALRQLSLQRLQTSGKELDAINELKQVSALSLSQTKIRTSNLQGLLNSDSLESLDLSGCPIDQELLQLLAKTRTLKLLVLAKDQLTEAQVEQLTKNNPNRRIEFVTIDPFTWPMRLPASENNTELASADSEISQSDNLLKSPRAAIAGNVGDWNRSITDRGRINLNDVRHLIREEAIRRELILQDGL